MQQTRASAHDIDIVRFDADVHDVTAITQLLHRAYKPLADMGLRYMATHQSPQITLQRLQHGLGYVALRDGDLIGTLTLYPTSPECTCMWYRRPDTWHFGQFAVDPAVKSLGYGAAMMDFVEHETLQHGVANLALDTSEHAHHLIEYYRKRSYKRVDRVTWPDVNYSSVVMSKVVGVR